LAPLLSQSSPLSAEAVAAQGDRQAATTTQQWRPDPHYAYLVITRIEKSAYAFLEGIAHRAQLEEAIPAVRRIAPSFDSAATLDFPFAEGLVVGVQ
jgi:hypothetical protein